MNIEQADFIFKKPEDNARVFVHAKQGGEKSNVVADLPYLSERYNSFLEDASLIYFSSGSPSGTIFLEAKEKLGRIEGKATEFRRETTGALKTLWACDSDNEDREENWSLSALDDYRERLETIESELKKSIIDSTVFLDGEDILYSDISEFLVWAPRWNSETIVLGSVVRFVQEIKYFLDQTEKIWHLFQISVEKIKFQIHQAMKKLEKGYSPILIGRGIEGYITYQTWARPPTVDFKRGLYHGFCSDLSLPGVDCFSILEIANV